MVKVAIVTGAGQGIGLAIAKRLHADGFKIGILDYNQETAEKAAQDISQTNTLPVVADVSKRKKSLPPLLKLFSILVICLSWSITLVLLRQRR